MLTTPSRPSAHVPQAATGSRGVSGGSGPVRERWARPAVAVFLALTALGYLWDLSASGYANSFYAAAVEAGSRSWKAMFFGSLDWSNFITVDKTPGSLWIPDLLARIFGFSSWTLLIPQALEGVAAVGLLYATVGRWYGARAGLLAGAALATTPVAALMFRFDNPDAFLVLLLVAGAWALTRALERASTRWMLLTGVFMGLAFLAKELQAFTVLPAFVAVWLVAAPTSLRRRILQLLAGGAALVVSAGWWVAIAALWPAASRPFVDGSPTNSVINLILEYNGLGRVFGGSGGAGGGAGSGFAGATGPLRLFNTLMGAQASWLLPAALLAMVGVLVWRGRAARTDRARAGVVLWGGWLVVTAAVFSFSTGIVHTYYTVALAPAIAALAGIGAATWWAHRDRVAARVAMAAGVALSASWGWALLDRTPTYHPWLRTVVVLTGVLAAAGILLAPALGRIGRRLVLTSAGLAAVACLAGPVAYAATTVTTAHTGSIPSAGPASAGGGFGGFGRGFAGGPSGGFSDRRTFTGVRPGGARGIPPGSVGGGAPGSAPTGTPGRASGSFSGFTRGGGTTVTGALTTALRLDASSYRWVAATDGSQSAAQIELSVSEPVMAIGGFSGQGGNLTLAQFESDVAHHEIHYFIGGSQGGPGRSNSGSAIMAWVVAHYTATTVGSQTVYNLSAAG